jgi:type I restriction enzyme S subunit
MDNKQFTEGGNLNLPSGWELVKIKDIGKITSGTTPLRSESKYHSNGTIAWVKTTDLNNSTITVTEEKITDIALKETSLRIYPKETILVAMYGGFNQIGRTGILGVEATINQALSAISVDKNEIYPIFLLNWLNAQVGLWKNFAGSSRKDPNITSKDVGDFPFIKIPYPEQKAIAQVLSTMDKAIQLTNQLIAQKELRKKWLMQNLLTGKKLLRGYDGAWKSVKLGTIGEFSKGSGISKSEILSKGFPCVRYGEIYTVHHTVIQKFNSFINEESVKISKPIYKGDILFAGSGETLEDIGKCVTFLNDVKAYAGGDIIILRPQQNINSLFLSYLLNSDDVTKQKVSMGKGHSVVHIYPKDIAQIEIQLPPIETQTAIAQILQAADKEIELLKAKAEKLKEQKRGMMQVLLTGKKRLMV